MTMMPESFEKIQKKDLPDDVAPKYKVGDLVKVQPGNPESIYGFYLHAGAGVVTDILYFKTLGYKTYTPQIFYIIEYKIRWIDKDEYGYVLEHSIELLEI
tara:strand:+ start:817 stop:1116 length:300 start_codon:yes stop_codon:yes gene_type:complete